MNNNPINHSFLFTREELLDCGYGEWAFVSLIVGSLQSARSYQDFISIKETFIGLDEFKRDTFKPLVNNDVISLNYFLRSKFYVP